MSREPEVGDVELVGSYLAGDRDALQAVDRWIDAALRPGFRSIQNQWDDIRQEVRLRVFGNLQAGRFNGDSTLRTYVHRVATNVAIDRLRVTYRDRRVTALGGNRAALEAFGCRDHEPTVMAREVLHRLLDSLSAGDLDLVDLVFVQHLSYVEVGRRLGISEGAVKIRVFRCRARLLRLRRRLEGPGGGVQ